MLNNQRISGLSWILSPAYLICGVIFFMFARKVALVFSDLRAPLLLPTRLFLWIGPLGWSAFMLSFSALLVVRRFKLHPAWLNSVTIAALWVTFGGAVVGVVCLAAVVRYQPICDFSSHFAAP